MVETTKETDRLSVDISLREDIKYMFTIEGFAPEPIGAIAYRRMKGFQTGRMKEIKCPYCGRLFSFVNMATKVRIYRRPNGKEVFCHETRMCRSCHNEVGVTFVQ